MSPAGRSPASVTSTATAGAISNGTQIINAANAYLAVVSNNWTIQLPLGE
jgi:hypothetical protein